MLIISFKFVVLKYIGYYAELPVPLPRDMQRDIFQMMELGVSQCKLNICEIHNCTCMYINDGHRDVAPMFVVNNFCQFCENPIVLSCSKVNSH